MCPTLLFFTFETLFPMIRCIIGYTLNTEGVYMIYFDNSATTKPYEEVLEAFVKTSQVFYANPSSLHRLGGQVEKLISQARQQVADIFSVKANEIYFTSGGTEGNNLAIKGTALQYHSRGNHIITTSIEHSSVYETCKQLEELGFTITYLPVNQQGQIHIEDLKAAITDKTILVSVMHVNNETGTVQPIEQIGSLLKNYPKILFHVDHVQGCGKVPLSIYGSGIDLCTVSAHKFHGLKGNGILYKRANVRISPILTGGHQEQNMRSGTENTAGIVTTAKALRLVTNQYEKHIDQLVTIRNYLIEQIAQLSHIAIHTDPIVAAPHIINFSAVGLRGEVLVHALEQEHIYVSTTSACSSKTKELSRTLLAMGVSEKAAEGAVRISLSFENTMDEAKTFIKVLKNTLNNLFQVVGEDR